MPHVLRKRLDHTTHFAGRFGAAWDGAATSLPPRGVALLYGDPGSDAVLAEVLAWHHLALDADGVTIGKLHLTVPDPFVIAALPVPGRPATSTC